VQNNKIFLPTKEEYHPTRSIHIGRHWESVSKDLGEKMKLVVDQGDVEKWTQEQYREALFDIMREERTLLRKGERQLNKHKRGDNNGE
jgi:hypothetical protein